jgi:enoyl-CoA hydratase/carnithine racemase
MSSKRSITKQESSISKGEKMAGQDLLYRVEDQIAYLTINREAQRNSISADVVALFFKYLDEAENDQMVRAVCITGAGEKAFCAGADLGGSMTGDGQDGFQHYADLLKRIAAFPKPTVARVNGYCLAGGTGFMLACDIVIAAEDARFGTPEVNVGLFPMMIGALIFRNVLKKKAMEMILLGEKLTADQALEMGLITRVVPAGKLDEEVGNVLEVLSGKSPIGIGLGKEAFYKTADMPFEEAVDYLSGQLKAVIATEDAKEGITAFIEKRKPNFIGK